MRPQAQAGTREEVGKKRLFLNLVKTAATLSSGDGGLQHRLQALVVVEVLLLPAHLRLVGRHLEKLARKKLNKKTSNVGTATFFRRTFFVLTKSLRSFKPHLKKRSLTFFRLKCEQLTGAFCIKNHTALLTQPYKFI